MVSALPDATVLSSAGSRASSDPGGARLRRIAFVVSSLSPYRTHRAGVSWISWFAQAGYDVDAIVVSDDSVSVKLPDAVGVHALGHRRRLRAQISALQTVIDEGRYDAVVAVQTVPNLLTIAACRRAEHRPVLVVAEQDLLSLRTPGTGVSGRHTVRLAKRRYRHADIVVSPSHPVAAEMAAAFGMPSSRSLIVPNPVLGDPGAARRASRIPGTSRGIQLVLLGLLEPGKSPDLALHAARVLSDRGIECEVVSVADGSLAGSLKALSRHLGVRYTPHAGDADPFAGLGPTAVALLPSRSEGLGDELIEAAARGVPAVALSTALGVADAVIPGVTGELALDDDPESIADAVSRAASITIGNVDEWLNRFSSEGSARLLEEAISYTTARS